jgi:glucose/arabinose dehydrogenase
VHTTRPARSRWLLRTAGALLLVGGVAAPASASAAAPAAVAATTVFSTGRQTVSAMAIAPDGRVFYVGPGTGSVFVWSPKTARTRTFATVPGGSGGFGVTLSPTFATDHLLYAYVTVGGHEQLVRYTDTRGNGTGLRLLRDVGPVGTEHTGGALVFSPSGKNLFLVVGDGGDPAQSQDPTVDHGKILRLTPLGAPAPGNPGFPDRAVWATGFRNSVGLAFDPRTAHLWESENGPECNDEINSIGGGKNYGWGPHEVCDGTTRGTNQDGPSPVQPAEVIADVVAPTGMTFCNGCGLAGAQGAMVYGRYVTSQLRKVTLDATGFRIASDRLLYQNATGVIAVQSSPVDHSIWFADLGHQVKRLH